MATDKSLETLLEERMQNLSTTTTTTPQHENGNSTAATAPLPPGMQHNLTSTPADLFASLNRVPLFMTSLDETDGSGGENLELEALKALAYEGTRAEVAQNFREQGTELVREEKRWAEAREFYSKALEALKRPPLPRDPEEEPRVVDVEEEEREAEKEREIEEVCLVNRALCHLEMKNYGSCNRDCAAALCLNPKNIKAWYRAASACLALDKIPEALDACESGLSYSPDNPALKTLLTKIEKRRDHLAELDRIHRDREASQRQIQTTLRTALQTRQIPTRTTPHPPAIPESSIALSTPLDPTSTLTFPTMLLYPLHAQTDFLQAFSEHDTLADHLSYILPLPWDEGNEYMLEGVECYMETREEGLVKVGKKVGLGKVLGSGRVEVVDGLVRVMVVPAGRVEEWVEGWKRRRGKR